MSESRIKLMKRLARIFESVSSVKSAIIGDSDNCVSPTPLNPPASGGKAEGTIKRGKAGGKQNKRRRLCEKQSYNNKRLS